jgi:Ca2+:H+ antiporter
MEASALKGFLLMGLVCDGSLVFPRWDVITVIFSVFLLTYTYQEGKANYFKGSILILSYIVLILAFYFTPPFSETSILIGV